MPSPRMPLRLQGRIIFRFIGAILSPVYFFLSSTAPPGPAPPWLFPPPLKQALTLVVYLVTTKSTLPRDPPRDRTRAMETLPVPEPGPHRRGDPPADQVYEGKVPAAGSVMRRDSPAFSPLPERTANLPARNERILRRIRLSRSCPGPGVSEADHR